MIKNALKYTAIAAVVLFSGCSHKESYKPISVKSSKSIDGKISSKIVGVTQNLALLDSGVVVDRDARELLSIPQGHRLINSSYKWVITQSPQKELVFSSTKSGDEDVVFSFNKDVAGATLEGNVLAVLFANNEIALFSFNDKKLLFKEEANQPIAVDSRIVNPYFLKELAVFPTLDGKIVIVNSQTKQPLRSIVVSSNNYFNNINYFKVIDNALVASTAYGVLSLEQKEARQKYDIKDVVFVDGTIYVATKQGEIIALNENLELKTKQKFPFAHFRAISVQDNNIYLLENGGYLIVLPRDLSSYEVFSVSLDKEDKVMVGAKAIYFDNKYILTP